MTRREPTPIYELLEATTDRCEDVADVIQNVSVTFAHTPLPHIPIGVDLTKDVGEGIAEISDPGAIR